ncbi:zinc finger 271-like [Paramuricea clavata]|uniref:Zinc finger 271-like n=1 Tax=Paramuricea clavata TaxID=317549 RepID=A0A7D9IY04_PARCT|nr:zinc finger 271-like [Paramuricea clavata]
MPRSFLIRKLLAISDNEDDDPTDAGREASEIGKERECAYTDPRPDKRPPVSHHETTTVHEDQTTEKHETTFHCELCTRSFNRASDLKRHQLAHIESKPYTCRVCDRQFTWLGNFHKHCATHAPSTPHLPFYPQPTIFSMCPPPPPPLFNTTPYSNPAFYFSSFPARPPMSHFGGCNQVSRVLQCSICRLTFTTSRALKMHTRIHSGEKPYKCGQCNKAFARKDELHTHKYFHTGNDGLFLRFYFEAIRSTK